MDITSIIIAIVSAGGIGTFFFYKENKRAKQLENDMNASRQWKELYEKAESKVEKQSLKIENLYRENNNLRNENNNLTTQRAHLVAYKCTVVGCDKRQPPFASQKTACETCEQ